MKRFYGFMLLSVMVLSLTTCGDNEKQNNEYLCKYLIIDEAITDNCLIEVTDSGIMTISTGNLCDNFYNKFLYEDESITESLYSYKFLKTVRMRDTVILARDELTRLKECIFKIKDVNLENPWIQGAWKDAITHMVIINDKKYVFVDIPSEDFSMFLKTILKPTNMEFRPHMGHTMSLDYDERHVHDCQRPDTTSYWVKIKKWFE